MWEDTCHIHTEKKPQKNKLERERLNSLWSWKKQIDEKQKISNYHGLTTNPSV